MVDPWRIQADPEWAVAIAIIALDYAVVVRAWRRRGTETPGLRIAAFAAGLVLIAVALLSPVEHIALTSLLSFHLLQNVILADWAPPLLVLGLSAAMIAACERRRPIRLLTSPAFALGYWLAAWYVAPRPGRVRLRAHPPLGARRRAPRLPDAGSPSGGRCSRPAGCSRDRSSSTCSARSSRPRPWRSRSR